MALTGSAFETAHPARVYDHFLGGKTNYAIDRAAGDQVLAVWPGARQAARANRAFMHRAVRILAQAGVHQFLDIGTGIPTEPNLHQIAQQTAPKARVVYVDKDPLVLAHADAWMRSTPEGRTGYVEADITTDVDRILTEAADFLDFGQPVAVSLIALLHFVPDDHDAHGIVARLLAPLPPGSALVISHGTEDFDPEVMRRVAAVYRNSGIATQARSWTELSRFFTGLTLVTPPGIEAPHRWCPDPTDTPQRAPDLDAQIAMWAGVGVKRPQLRGRPRRG
ncbi:SAM-dependent methyltransferase [Streptomyces sp. B6B3]|uniref:SAM-dependent methyltransferase n=1 Tax=Streptomyces sp. B6B3 TaxID=3153570 RepID=UPI00325EAC09